MRPGAGVRGIKHAAQDHATQQSRTNRRTASSIHVRNLLTDFPHQLFARIGLRLSQDSFTMPCWGRETLAGNVVHLSMAKSAKDCRPLTL